MKRILYLTPGCFDKGGISRYNRYQISALRELVGEENIRVFSLLGPQTGDFEENFQVNWHGWGASTLSKIWFTFRVLAQVYRWKPEVIWLGHINMTEILVRFKLLKKVKSVLNIYGLEIWSGLRPAVEKGFKNVDYVISDCYFTAGYAEENGYRKKGTIEVIWDCVDLEKFTPIKSQNEARFYEAYKLPDPETNPWILTLGRLSFTAAHKGYERLLKVYSQLAMAESKSVLVFAGKGDMIETLKKIAEDYKVTDRVYFSGMVHEDDLPKFYRASKVFSLVSDRGLGRGEGIPLTPLEAMACGSPIIVGNQDGSQEAIFNGQNGYCIDPFDLEKHQKVILDLISDDLLYKEKSAAALKIANTYFSYSEFKKKHEHFIQKRL